MSTDVLDYPPTEIEPNWELAKALYSQGATHDLICQQAHVSITALRKRITRGRWTIIRADVAGVEKVIQSPTPISKALSDASTQVKESLAKRLKAHAEVLDGLSQPTSLKEIRIENEALASMIANGKIIFSWDQSGSITTFNTFNFTARTVGPAQPLPIDVQSQPVESKQVTQLDNQSTSTDGVNSATPTVS